MPTGFLVAGPFDPSTMSFLSDVLPKAHPGEIELVGVCEAVADLAKLLAASTGKEVNWVIIQAFVRGRPATQDVADARNALNRTLSTEPVRILAVSPQHDQTKPLHKQFRKAGADAFLYLHDMTIPRLMQVLCGDPGAFLRADALPIGSLHLIPVRRRLIFRDQFNEFDVWDLAPRYVQLLTYLAIARQNRQFHWFQLKKRSKALLDSDPPSGNVVVARKELWDSLWPLRELSLSIDGRRSVEKEIEALSSPKRLDDKKEIHIKSLGNDISVINTQCRMAVFPYLLCKSDSGESYLINRYSKESNCVVLAESIAPSQVSIDFRS